MTYEEAIRELKISYLSDSESIKEAKQVAVNVLEGIVELQKEFIILLDDFNYEVKDDRKRSN